MNTLVKNAIAARGGAVAKNALTSGQYKEISKILGDAQKSLAKCDDACKTIRMSLDDIERGLARMWRNFDKEAYYDAYVLEVVLKEAYKRVENFSQHLAASLALKADKYSHPDPKRLIDG